MERVVVVLGRGRMGRALALALPRVKLLGARDFLSAPRRPARGAITWLFAVRDADIAPAVGRVSAHLRHGDVAVHLAGAVGVEALSEARDAGASVGALHPLCAVAAGNRRAVLRGSAFLFEGDRAARAECRRRVRALGGTMLSARAVDRAMYHGGAALVATGAVALAQGAHALFARALTPRASDAELHAAVASLLRSVASNVEAVGAQRALASPLLRDDTATVARHLAAMAVFPAVQGMYSAAIGQVVEALESQGGARAETLAEARRLVESHSAPRVGRGSP